jgi:hypothetical protein
VESPGFLLGLAAWKYWLTQKTAVCFDDKLQQVCTTGELAAAEHKTALDS